jgi:hypothetical protein
MDTNTNTLDLSKSYKIYAVVYHTRALYVGATKRKLAERLQNHLADAAAA